MKLLIICLAVTFVTADTLVGSKRCSWGPTYWCSHIDHAKECGAVDHCMSTVWKHKILQPQSTEECLYCQMGFNELKDVLADKSIEQDISKYVADVCKILPDKDWGTICDGIVSEDLPIIIQMLDYKLNSQMICATMGMCSGLEDTVSPYSSLPENKVAEAKAGNSTCTDCTKFFQDVQQSITSQETENELAQLINQVLCNRIPSFTAVCQDAVDHVIPLALQFLADQLDPSVTCRVFGFCVTSRPIDTLPLKNVFKNLKQPLKYRSSEECEACKEIMGEVVDEIRDNNTQAAVVSFLKTNVCSDLGALASECNSLVDQYMPALFEVLVNELDPTTICEMAGLCVVPGGRQLTMLAAKLEPARLISPGYKADSTALCFICEQVMQEVVNILERNVTIKSVEDLIDKVCNKFPSDDLKSQCLSFVKTNGPLVIDMLAKALNPNLICAKLKFCAAKLNAGFPDIKNTECDFCIIGVHIMEVYLANVSQDTLMTGARTICAFLPTNLSIECLKYVNEYLPLVINILKTKEDPKSLCELGGICTATVARKPFMTKPIPEETEPSVANAVGTVGAAPSEVCKICNTIILVLKSELGNNATKEEIREALDGLCEKLSSLVMECEALVNKYSKRIIEVILAHSADICKDIELCPSKISNIQGVMAGILSPVDTLPIVTDEGKKEPSVHVASTNVEANAAPSEVCKICNTAMFLLKEEIGNNATEDEIRDALKAVCKKAPKALQSVCETFVAKYTEEIIKAILKHSGDICKDIGLCTSKISNIHGVLAGILSPVDTLPIVTDEDQHPSKTVGSGQGTECTVCKDVVIAVKYLLQNPGMEEALSSGIEKFCKVLPNADLEACKNIVQEYGVDFVDLLFDRINPDLICQEVQLCSTTSQNALGAQTGIISPVDTLPIAMKEGSPTSNGVDCEVCMYVMTVGDKALQQKSTQIAIQGVLLTGCEILGSSAKAVCEGLVNKYTKEAINFFILSQTPATLCKELKFCTAAVKVGQPLEVFEVLPVNVNSGVTCEACKLAAGYLKSLLKENATKEEIEAALDALCSYLPSTYTSECDTLVQTYGDRIVELLEEEISPDVLCNKLGLCTADKVVGMVEVKKLPLNDKVDTYWDRIVELLMEEINPAICKELGLCTADKVVGMTKVKKLSLNDKASSENVDASVECVVCEFVMSELESQLTTNVTKAEIEAALKEVCSLIPTTISAECQSFVTKYGGIIIGLIVDEVSPAKICTAIKLCTADKMAGLVTMVKILPAKDKVGVDFCGPCKQVVDYVKMLLSKNETKQEIIEYFKETCDYVLPDTVTVQCEDAVEQYVPAVIALIEQDLSSDQICEQLKFCNATVSKADDRLFFHPRAKVFGAEKCTYGPAYWCASEENAKRCNAEEHCMRHVWNK